MEKDLAEFILNLIEEYTLFEATLIPDYIGRAMLFNETTYAIQVDEEQDRALLVLSIEILRNSPSSLNSFNEREKELLYRFFDYVENSIRKDRLGYDYVFY